MNETEALERLAAADPAAGVEVAWSGPPEVLEPAHRPTRTVLLAAAAAVVLVAGIASALALTRGSHHAHDALATPGAGGPTDPPDMLIAPGAPDPNPARTRALLATLLRTTPTLPQAVRHRSAPVPALRSGSSSHGFSSHEIRLTEWFTAPGSVDAAGAYFLAHSPSDRSTGGSSSGGNGYVGLDFDVQLPRDDAATLQATVEVDVVPFRGGVAVRVDAYAFWLPSRTTDSIIGESTSAVATVEKVSASPRKEGPVVRHLPARIATQLAREIDGLPGGVEVSHSCPYFPFGATEQLTFTTPHGTYVVTPTDSACGSTTQLRTPAGRVYALGRGTLFADVLAAAGLPKDYGHR